ncbi:MAG: acetyl CoA synthetase [Crenarchaeota archaeon]|nr:acetyl CoA synthetase [Thermoproteota archaeon]
MSRQHTVLWELFRPSSVAVVGASRHPGKVGHSILRNLVASYKGKIYPVNPLAKQILGLKCYPRLTAIPDSVDMAVIAIPAPKVPDVVCDACKKGVKVSVIISSGFSEVGNHELERRVVETAKSCGMRIVGPNVFGVIYTPIGLNATFGPPEVPRGSVAVITQSGALGLALLYRFMGVKGLGFSAMLSLGNMSDIDFADAIWVLGEDEHTRVIALYVEGLRPLRGRAFIEAARHAAKKKPIVAIKAGRSKRGSKAVASHTGSMAGDVSIYQAAFRKAGVFMVRSLSGLLDASLLFSLQPIPPQPWRGVMIVTNGGGLGVLAVDAMEELGVTLAKLSPETRSKIRSMLPWFASTLNPIDTTASITTDTYLEVLHAAVDAPDASAVLAMFAELPNMKGEELAKGMEDILRHARERGKPLLLVYVGKHEIFYQFAAEGIPVYESPYEAAEALHALEWYVRWRAKHAQ